MFKYIKKLTSVVVMFAVIIVFSPSKVYADKHREINYNPFFILYAVSFLSTNFEFDFADANTFLTEQIEKISRSEDPIRDLNDIAEGLGMQSRLDVNDDPFRRIEIKLSQKDMKKYFFDCTYNKITKLYELTEKGKKDFEKAKEKKRKDKENNDSGGW